MKLLLSIVLLLGVASMASAQGFSLSIGTNGGYYSSGYNSYYYSNPVYAYPPVYVAPQTFYYVPSYVPYVPRYTVPYYYAPKPYDNDRHRNNNRHR